MNVKSFERLKNNLRTLVLDVAPGLTGQSVLVDEKLFLCHQDEWTMPEDLDNFLNIINELNLIGFLERSLDQIRASNSGCIQAVKDGIALLKISPLTKDAMIERLRRNPVWVQEQRDRLRFLASPQFLSLAPQKNSQNKKQIQTKSNGWRK